METAAFILAWYAFGALGSAVILEFLYRRGSYPLDIRVADIVFGAAMAVFGPPMLAVGALFFLGWAVRFLARSTRLDMDRVVFRRSSTTN